MRLLRSSQPVAIDMTGKSFGLLDVQERSAEYNYSGAKWWCRCASCGARVVKVGTDLRTDIRKGDRKFPHACPNCSRAMRSHAGKRAPAGFAWCPVCRELVATAELTGHVRGQRCSQAGEGR